MGGFSVTGPLADVPGQMAAQAGLLDIALMAWAGRDDSKAQLGVRRAANTAITTIDDMIRELQATRAALVTEIRASNDAAMARTAAMLADGES